MCLSYDVLSHPSRYVCKHCGDKAVHLFKQETWEMLPEKFKQRIPVRMTHQFGYDVSAMEKLERRSVSKQAFNDICNEAHEMENDKIHTSIEK